MMGRNAIALFALGVLGMLLITFANHMPSEAARVLGPLVLGLVTVMAGTFLLVRRKSLVHETVKAYERSPKITQAIYGAYQRLYRFKTYESFAMFNTSVVGIGFLTMGLVILGFLAYRLMRGL